METPNTTRTALHNAVLKVVLHMWNQTRGQHWLPITGCSMLPLLREGDSILVAHGSAGVCRGDVVVFRQQGRLTAHRVVCISGSKDHPTLITKGDNAAQCDPPVSANGIVGRVLAVKRDGQCLPLDTTARRVAGWLLAASACTWCTRARWSRRRKQRRRGPQPHRWMAFLRRRAWAIFLRVFTMV